MKRFTAIVLMALGAAACDSPTKPSRSPEPSASVGTEVTTFRVNSTGDAVDAAPGNGVCRTASGACTLRAAIQEANALAGAQAVMLPAGVYKITLAEPANGGIAGGDLDITGPARITGAGAARTTIDGNLRKHRVVVVAGTAGSRVELSGVTIRGGRTEEYGDGGGLRIEAGAMVVLRLVTVRDNFGSRNSAGGGIYNTGTLTLDRSLVTGNGARDAGGITNGGTLLVTRSTISNNQAADIGGLGNGGTLTMANSTVSGNGAEVYGGISNNGRATLNNVTITRNKAAIHGGLSTSGVVTVSNTLIAGNTEAGGSSPDCDGTLTSAGYNLIGSTRGCTVTGNRTGNKVGIAAQLGPLQNNGGPTRTHALLKGCPAINAGNPAQPGTREPVCTRKDQRLLPRGATRCDIGSFEVQGP